MTDVMAERGLRERKKEQTRTAISHVAVGLFLERGYDHVSIADIAEAAGVAKMTVTNYFPAKEDLVISAGASVVPDLAGAVRGRAPGESPVAALARFVQSELDRRAEWTGLHDGVTQFARMSMASPALLEAFGRVWDGVQSELAQAFEEAAGELAPAALSGNAATGLIRAGGDQEAEAALAALAAGLTVPRIRAQVAAAQVAGSVRILTGANVIRQAAGLSADQTAAQSRAETAAAFELLESGLGTFGLGTSGPENSGPENSGPGSSGA
jgi:AcrR family transcriptional regulator